MPKTFVSYSRVDKHFTNRLVERLRRIYTHADVWYDDSLHGGDLWWQEILSQIAAADIFIYVLSNDSVTSPYCQAEFEEAQRLQKRIITVQARDKTKLTGTLRDIHYIDMTAGADDGPSFDDLIRAINKQAEFVKRRRPLWKPATPKPETAEPAADPNRPSVTTPDLQPSHAPSATPGGCLKWLNEPIAILMAAVITGLFGLLATYIALAPRGTDPADLRETIYAEDTLTALSSPSVTAASQIRATIYAEDTATAQTRLDITATAVSLAQVPPTETSPMFTGATDAVSTATPTPPAPTEASPLFTGGTEGGVSTATPTPTNTPEPPTATPTNTPSPTPDVTETRRVALATLAAVQTATAAAIPTATPDPLQAAYERALAFADLPDATNADWQPFEWTFDGGVPMVLVPAGCFEMGSTMSSDEQPVHTRCFDEPFWIDKYEVTNAQFARFLNENPNGNRGPISDVEYLDDDDSDARIRLVDGVWQADEAYADHPVIEVTWFGARDFCAWRNGSRLPREDEWEYAARGPSALVYPWGDVFDGERVNYCDRSCTLDWRDASFDDGHDQTALVDVFPNGASWVGAEQLAGNVWEWVSSEYQTYPYDETDGREDNVNSTSVRRALRGGSWLNDDTDVRAASRYRFNPYNTINLNGFRCSRSY